MSKMTNTNFVQYYKQRIKLVFNHLMEFDLNETENALHDFRVEVKKLKAILKFLKTVYPKQKLKKVSRQLNQVFQQSGEIRENQLLLKWLSKNELNLIIEQLFPESNLEILIGKFHKEVGNFKKELKELNELVLEYVQNTNEIVATHYTIDLSIQMNELIRNNCSFSEWHELRKLIKQWMYAINWVEETSTVDISFYQKLQENIGYWHDAQDIKETLMQKKIFLSPDVELQKSFSIAIEKLNQSIRYREKQIHELFNKKELATI